jgi:RimJ/RimL family protein N-acetyltransferase
MLTPSYPIRTDRLVLRPFDTADEDDWYAIRSRDDVARYLYGQALTREGARVEVERKRGNTALRDEGDVLSLAVVEPSAARVIGEVILRWRSRVHQQGEIGFVFHPESGGKGYATEAATAMLDLGFEALGLHRIFGSCDARNRASAALMERLGMRREAHFIHNEIFKGEWGEEYYYAILRDEWSAKRTPDDRGERRS